MGFKQRSQRNQQLFLLLFIKAKSFWLVRIFQFRALTCDRLLGLILENLNLSKYFFPLVLYILLCFMCLPVLCTFIDFILNTLGLCLTDGNELSAVPERFRKFRVWKWLVQLNLSFIFFKKFLFWRNIFNISTLFLIFWTFQQTLVSLPDTPFLGDILKSHRSWNVFILWLPKKLKFFVRMLTTLIRL